MRRPLLASVLVLTLAACGGSDDDAGDDDAAATTATPATISSASAEEAPGTVVAPATTAAADPGADAAAPGPGDAVGTLTGPDVDIAVVGQCTYDVGDLTSSDIAFADVRGVDPSGVEWPARFGLSGSPDRNTQVNINGTQVVVRWPEPGLVEQSSDDGSYLLDTTIGRLVVTAGGYELNISCFER